MTVKGAGSGGGMRFRLCSYNVLAEIYATQQAYPYCDFWALSWGKWDNVPGCVFMGTYVFVCIFPEQKTPGVKQPGVQKFLTSHPTDFESFIPCSDCNHKNSNPTPLVVNSMKMDPKIRFFVIS